MNSLPTGMAMSPAKFMKLASRGKRYCPPHLAILNQRMMDLATGQITRQATFMPPRHGKSEFRSKYFPAWYLGTFPDRRVILAAYNDSFAAEWGMKVRDLLKDVGEEFFGIKIRQDRSASDNWGIVGHEGGMQTVGVGGGLTGRGADLLLIDDPIKKPEEAQSETFRDKQWDWYVSAADSRLEPDGVMCLTMTPWHAKDLGGMILEREAGLWDVLRLPAIPDEFIEDWKREGKVGYDYYVGQPDPLGRRPGEPLWPQRYGTPFFDRKRAQDPFWFDALYNCSPRPREGSVFKYEWFKGKVHPGSPREARRVRYWDKAASQGKGDWTVGVLVAEKDRKIWIEDVKREQLSPMGRDAMIRRTAESDKAAHGHVSIWGEQEPGSSGVDSSQAFIQNLMGFQVSLDKVTGDKASRARPFASYCEAGNVYLREGHWNAAFLEELIAFRDDGKSKHDDQVDAASGGFSKLALGASYQPAQAGAPRAIHDPIEAILAIQGAVW